ncbi:unnamed protein product [Clavelina lepadiformis]|uniref:CUB domain-containing protein n=1 Tax=Clavelina lepadiformis TaxID=159417 RepID=A0ABP0GWP6_CLALP
MENSKTVAKLEGNFSLPQRFLSSKDVLRIYFHSNDASDNFAGNVTQGSVLDGDNFLYNFQGSYLTAYEEKAAVVLTSTSNTLTILHNMESRSYSSGFSVTYRKLKPSNNPLLPMQVK